MYVGRRTLASYKAAQCGFACQTSPCSVKVILRSGKSGGGTFGVAAALANGDGGGAGFGTGALLLLLLLPPGTPGGGGFALAAVCSDGPVNAHKASVCVACVPIHRGLELDSV